MPFIALVDANALWPEAVRDVLLRAAGQGLYRLLWTKAILDEVERSLNGRRPDLGPERIGKLITQMQTAFPGAMVEDYEDLIPVMQNDPKDRHVLAAAIRSGAGVVITDNIRDFPDHACTPYNIDIQTPDAFLCHLWDLNPEDMALVLRQRSQALKRPPLSVLQVVEGLQSRVPAFAEMALQSGLLQTSS